VFSPLRLTLKKESGLCEPVLRWHRVASYTWAKGAKFSLHCSVFYHAATLVILSLDRCELDNTSHDSKFQLMMMMVSERSGSYSQKL
jgi:hypothetical protein